MPPQSAKHPQIPGPGGDVTPSGRPRHFPVTTVPSAQVNGHVPLHPTVGSHIPGGGGCGQSSAQTQRDTFTPGSAGPIGTHLPSAVSPFGHCPSHVPEQGSAPSHGPGVGVGGGGPHEAVHAHFGGTPSGTGTGAHVPASVVPSAQVTEQGPPQVASSSQDLIGGVGGGPQAPKHLHLGPTGIVVGSNGSTTTKTH